MSSPVSNGMGDHSRALTSHAGQLSLLLSAGWKLSISQTVVMLYSWVVKSGMVFYLWIKCVDGR